MVVSLWPAFLAHPVVLFLASIVVAVWPFVDQQFIPMYFDHDMTVYSFEDHDSAAECTPRTEGQLTCHDVSLFKLIFRR